MSRSIWAFGRVGIGEGDTYVDIETVSGSRRINTLIGDKGDNRLPGDTGADELSGALGNEFLPGSAGLDVADNSGSFASIRANLVSNSGKGGDAKGDKLRSIDDVISTGFGDVSLGNYKANLLDGALASTL